MRLRGVFDAPVSEDLKKKKSRATFMMMLPCHDINTSPKRKPTVQACAFERAVTRLWVHDAGFEGTMSVGDVADGHAHEACTRSREGEQRAQGGNLGSPPRCSR